MNLKTIVVLRLLSCIIVVREANCKVGGDVQGSISAIVAQLERNQQKFKIFLTKKFFFAQQNFFFFFKFFEI